MDGRMDSICIRDEMNRMGNGAQIYKVVNE